MKPRDEQEQAAAPARKHGEPYTSHLLGHDRRPNRPCGLSSSTSMITRNGASEIALRRNQKPDQVLDHAEQDARRDAAGQAGEAADDRCGEGRV